MKSKFLALTRVEYNLQEILDDIRRFPDLLKKRILYNLNEKLRPVEEGVYGVTKQLKLKPIFLKYRALESGLPVIETKIESGILLLEYLLNTECYGRGRPFVTVTDGKNVLPSGEFLDFN